MCGWRLRAYLHQLRKRAAVSNVMHCLAGHLQYAPLQIRFRAAHTLYVHVFTRPRLSTHVTAAWRRECFRSPNSSARRVRCRRVLTLTINHAVVSVRLCITLFRVFFGHASPSMDIGHITEQIKGHFPPPLHTRNGSALGLYCRWSGGVRASAA